MRKYLLCLGVGMMMVLTLVNVEGRAADDADLVKEVNKSAEKVGDKSWDDLVKETAPLAKKFDPEQVMHLLAKRNPANNKGGVGIGPKAGTIEPDGIEAKTINMVKQGIPTKEMESAADFKKMADQLQVIAAITMNQAPDKKSGDKDPAVWKKSSKEMYEAAKEFAKAVDAKDNAKIKAAAKKLDGSCKECHGPFRP